LFFNECREIDDINKQVAGTAGYGLLRAHDCENGYDICIENKIVGTFAVRNTLRAGDLHGDYPFEIIQPTLVFNSDIKHALISYDLLKFDASDLSQVAEITYRGSQDIKIVGASDYKNLLERWLNG
jgi:hypothetical protein